MVSAGGGKTMGPLLLGQSYTKNIGPNGEKIKGKTGKSKKNPVIG
jgi:hypothetical protein